MSIDWRVLSGSRVSRRSLLKMAAATGVIAACGAPTTAPGAATASGKAMKGGTLIAGWSLDKFDFLDPHRVNLGQQMELLVNIFDGLTRLTPEVDVEADLAEKWDVSEDGKKYTFHLRKGVKWHDGSPFTSEDVIFSYDRVLDKDFGSPHSGKLAPIDSVDAPDDHTVVFTLKAPFAPFLTTVTNFPGRALTPVSKAAVEKMGKDKYNLEPVGTGPFRITKHTPGQEVVLERFDDYWHKDVPLLDKIVVKLIPEEGTINSALKAGDIDFIDLPPNQFVKDLESSDDFTVSKVSGTNWLGLQMSYTDPQAPFLADKDVRMGIAKAIDRQTLVDKAYFGLAVPAYGVLNPAVKWAFREDKPRTQKFDIEEAKKLISQGGATGKEVEIMTTPSGQREAEIVAQMLQSAGLKVKLDVQEGAIYRRRRDQGEFMIIHSGSVVDPDPDESVWNFFYSKGPWNRFHYKSDKADELLTNQRQTKDKEERAKILADLEDLLTKDAVVAWTTHLLDVVAFSKRVKGWKHVPELRPFHSVSIEK